MKRTLFALFVLALAVPTFAQDVTPRPVPAPSAQELTLPGSMWTTNGTLSPVEKGNWNSQTHIEQGVAFKGFELFGQFTGGYDQQAFDWNRHTLLGVGGRYTLNLPGGNIRASYSYVAEHRYVTNSQANGPTFVVDAWFGWNLRPKR